LTRKLTEAFVPGKPFHPNLIFTREAGIYSSEAPLGQARAGNTNGGSITVLLTSCLTSLD